MGKHENSLSFLFLSLMSSIRYAHSNGCEWDERTCEAAAVKGILHILKYAHKNGCKWDGKTHVTAARSGICSK
jgi:hypothetical protein